MSSVRRAVTKRGAVTKRVAKKKKAPAMTYEQQPVQHVNQEVDENAA